MDESHAGSTGEYAGSRAVDDEQRTRQQLNAIAQGDRVAFERFYLAHYSQLARFLARQTARRDLLDEIINDTFWIVWRKAGEFRGSSKVSTWVIGIAYRCLLKSLRSQKSVAHESISEDIANDDIGTSISDEEQRELGDWVKRGVALLPADQRTTIELAYYLGQSCEEIATIMECAVGTVKARMFHARLRLRNTLPALGGDLAASNAQQR
ncbi:MAG: sigma-70 family RNA polymerase sigma factor [Tahibacter sp.]